MHEYNVPPSEGCQALLRDITHKLYINTMYLLLRVAKLHSQVIHKYSVPPSERCQTPFEEFHLRVIHKGS